MQAPGIPWKNLQDQGQAKLGPNAASTGIRGTESVSLWDKFKRTCGAGPAVDTFDAHSFDEDAKAFDDRDDANPSPCSPEDGSLAEKGC